MSAQTLPAPVGNRADHDDLDHYVCEDHPDVTLCGLDASAMPWLPPEMGPHDCVVCLDLRGHCRECGT